jgi:nucleotide-binding universal stress UspA family protein
MSWKDILVIVSDAEHDEPALALGEALVGQHADCNLAAAFLTPLPDEPLAYEPTVVAGVWAELLGRARQEAEVERKKVEERLNRSAALDVDFRSAEALSRDLGRVAAVHARYADVAIMTRPSDGPGVELREEVIEGVLFHSGRPALIAPPGWRGTGIGKRVVVAWDASREATRALSEAKSILQTAEQITVLTVDAKPKMFGHGDQPGANIAAHLSRRGLPSEVRNVDSMGRSASAAIMEEAQALNADLVVMGGYAHSRLRELVFGGATRELLRTATVPLLMAH